MPRKVRLEIYEIKKTGYRRPQRFFPKVFAKNNELILFGETHVNRGDVVEMLENLVKEIQAGNYVIDPKK